MEQVSQERQARRLQVEVKQVEEKLEMKEKWILRQTNFEGYTQLGGKSGKKDTEEIPEIKCNFNKFLELVPEVT